VLRNEKSLLELKINKSSKNEEWDEWVVQWFRSQYKHSPLTLRRYENAWRNLSSYLRARGIRHPRQLTFHDCERYMDWRIKGQTELGIYRCAHNTARWELKILHHVAQHAIKRGFIQTNPSDSLGIPRQPAREKPELSDADIATIREGFATQKSPEWMRICFEIAIHQGCRLQETSFPLSRVDWKRQTIEFHAKRGKRFTAPIHRNLLPMLERLKAEGREKTCELPALPSKDWWRFFKAIGLGQKGISFHCTRVTVITRLIRAGVPENKVKKIVNHASTEVHRIYQRLGVDDVRSSLDGLEV
jgi:site-specific recombinase XerD